MCARTRAGEGPCPFGLFLNVEPHLSMFFFKKANLVNYNHKGLSTSNVDGQETLLKDLLWKPAPGPSSSFLAQEV